MQTTTFLGDPVHLSGNTINVGDKAPLVTAIGTDLSGCRDWWSER